jgi:hypothetical protein
MPRSLKALFVQLKAGYDATAVRMQVNASMGAANALDAPILCFAVFLCCVKVVFLWYVWFVLFLGFAFEKLKLAAFGIFFDGNFLHFPTTA